jgi:small subunit ribosomal protein S13
MARILGITLDDNARIEYALTKVYGVGFATSRQILKFSKIDKNTRVKTLSEADIKKIQEVLEKDRKVEGDLKEEVNSHIKRLREISSYRGMRHARGLPSRGQRTKSNARTKRGKRKTVGALKKEDMIKLQDAAAKK